MPDTSQNVCERHWAGSQEWAENVMQICAGTRTDSNSVPLPQAARPDTKNGTARHPELSRTLRDSPLPSPKPKPVSQAPGAAPPSGSNLATPGPSNLGFKPGPTLATAGPSNLGFKSGAPPAAAKRMPFESAGSLGSGAGRGWKKRRTEDDEDYVVRGEGRGAKKARIAQGSAAVGKAPVGGAGDPEGRLGDVSHGVNPGMGTAQPGVPPRVAGRPHTPADDVDVDVEMEDADEDGPSKRAIEEVCAEECAGGQNTLIIYVCVCMYVCFFVCMCVM
jgi:hypothetical protein